VTTTLRDTHRFGYPSRQPAEVVAVLVDDGSARAVASVAVQEAVGRDAPVRFLQVVPTYHHDEGSGLAEDRMFRAALLALHGHPRTHSVFEVVRSDPTAAVRTRSRDAALVVVGVDEERDVPEGPSLANRCRTVASCPVQTVPIPIDPFG
jgi:nucleotide-binding universal stress UspA family protein